MTHPRVPIGDVTEIVSGATPDTGVPDYWGGDIWWATPKDLSALSGATIDRTARTITAKGLSSCAARVLPPGAVLFSSRAPIGHVAINLAPMATNQGFKSFIPRAGVLENRYLYHWLRANRPRLEAMGSGATFKELSKAAVERIELPLPPLAEQRRIADLLDRAHGLRVLREKSIGAYDALASGVFTALFGDLGANSRQFPIGTIGDLASEVTYGTSQRAADGRAALPILRMGNISVMGRLLLHDLKYIDLEPATMERYTVRRGDILFNRTNSPDLVGKTGLYELDEPMAYAGYLIRLRTNERAVPEYVWAVLNSSYGKAVLRGMCKEIIGMANINATELKAVKVPIPPIALQHKWAQMRGDIERRRSIAAAQLPLLSDLASGLQGVFLPIS